MAYLLFNEDGELPMYGYFFENVKNSKELLAKAKSGIPRHHRSQSDLILALEEATNTNLIFHFNIYPAVFVGDLNLCLLNAKTVIDPLHLQMAVRRAVKNRASGQMITKSIFAEIMFCMSPLRSIMDTFRKFGVTEGDTSLIAITADKCENINNIIEGNL